MRRSSDRIVEFCGSWNSVHTHTLLRQEPKRTTEIHVVLNLALKPPNIATIMAKNLLSPLMVSFLSLCACAEAQIGRTLDECRKSYGDAEDFRNRGEVYVFNPVIESRSSQKTPYLILAFFVDGRVSAIHYFIDKDQSADKSGKLYVEDAKYLLKYCVPEVVWSDPSHNDTKTEMNWSGSVNGVVTYTARLKGTYSIEIVDEATNAGGVFGAKREIINGQSYSVLPRADSEYDPNQKVASGPAPTPAKLTIESANADLARAWQSLTSQKRDQLSKEERTWIHQRDSLPAEERIKSTADRAKYIWSFVERTFDD